jgi:hypothetical protein
MVDHLDQQQLDGLAGGSGGGGAAQPGQGEGAAAGEGAAGGAGAGAGAEQRLFTGEHALHLVEVRG